MFHFKGAVGACIVDNDDFEVDIFEVLEQKPDNDGQVLALIVGGQQD
jgi:hypothetical protein